MVEVGVCQEGSGERLHHGPIEAEGEVKTALNLTNFILCLHPYIRQINKNQFIK